MAALSTVQRAIGGGMLAVIVVLGLWAARLEYLRAGYKADLTACKSAHELGIVRSSPEPAPSSGSKSPSRPISRIAKSNTPSVSGW